jgi:antitoxin CptB
MRKDFFKRLFMSGTTLSTQYLSPLQKKLLIRAWHRGTREMDLLLGGFADRHITNFNAQELSDFEDMIAYLDGDMLDWITGAAPLPADANTPMMQRLLIDVKNNPPFA